MSQKKLSILKCFSYQNGMSHVELMIAIALVTILSVSALPGVDRMMDRNKVMDTRHDLLNDLNFARNTAISNYRHVVICPSSNQQTCNGKSTWSESWIVFQDTNADQQRNVSERILRTGYPGKNISISSELRNHFSFAPDGNSGESVGSLLLCVDNKITMGHRLAVSKTGRVNSEDYRCNS